MRWVFKLDSRYVLCQSNRWPGSLMCERLAMPQYLSNSRSEDSLLLEDLLELGHGLALVPETGLYIYEYHGSNTWGRQHFEQMISIYGVAEFSEAHLQDALGYEPPVILE